MARRTNFTKYDLGHLKKGRIVVVTLKGSPANVRLMCSSDFNAYRNGRRHRYIGGFTKRSPVRFAIPHSGHWFVAIDMDGLHGRVRTSVSVEPEPLPAIKQSTSLMEVPTLVNDTSSVIPDASGKIYDVFISHASEDKDTVARPLANALKDAGLVVWFDEFEMNIGDSLHRKIDQGLAHSKFGVVIISNNFIKKGWTNYELDGIFTRSVSGEQALLPIWHNITKDEVIAYSPTLADRIARNTAVESIDDIATEISDLITSRIARDG